MQRRRRFEDQPVEETKSRKRKNKFILEKSTLFDKYPTILPTNLTKSQLEAEIQHKLRTRELPHIRARSPSPEPVFDEHGRRINTREARQRQKLETERRKLVDDAVRNHPEFNQDRKGVSSDRIYIPAKDYPEINFIGLLIGPRGTTLKDMENASGAKLSIRGKGSHKEGKVRPEDDDDDDLHCYITADTEDKVAKAAKMVLRIISSSASVGDTELKKIQLRKLAIINGGAREAENDIVCSNCGMAGHRRFECPERSTVAGNVACRICGSVGHLSKDCVHRNDPQYIQKSQQIDREYASFLNELGTKEEEKQVINISQNQTSQAPWHQMSQPIQWDPTLMPYGGDDAIGSYDPNSYYADYHAVAWNIQQQAAAAQWANQGY